MDSYNILVVEDEKNILDVVSAYLTKENFKVFRAIDGEKALEIFNNENIHLIILDLMIPKISGEEVCSRIRNTSNVPIIMLTAKVDEDSRVEGLSIGADDYVLKPFSPRELISRVKALLRRSYRTDSIKPLAEKVSFDNGRVIVEKEKMIVRKDDKIVDFTSNEFKILLAFINNSGLVLSREQLIELAFGYDYEGFDRTIDTHIKNIRQKLEDKPKTPAYILTVYGVGYKLNSD